MIQACYMLRWLVLNLWSRGREPGAPEPAVPVPIIAVVPELYMWSISIRFTRWNSLLILFVLMIKQVFLI